jgi:predicted O-methyltransferase YrrM
VAPTIVVASTGLVLFLSLALAAWILSRKIHRVRAMLRRQERFVWETHNLFTLLVPSAPLPYPGGWAASTDLLLELVQQILARRPQLVVELGSGLSTLIIAAALKRNGRGRLISIDADEAYAQQTRAQLGVHQLGDWAEVRAASLKEFDFEGIRRPWYDTVVLEDLHEIDLLFVDGPPTRLRADIRYPSLPYFWDRLRSGAVMLLDDANRPAEAAMSEAWQRTFVQAEFDRLGFEKGALRVVKR